MTKGLFETKVVQFLCGLLLHFFIFTGSRPASILMLVAVFCSHE